MAFYTRDVYEKTGEGKTLAKPLCPVYLNALEGKGVHVVTALSAKRDRDQMAKIYDYP